MGYPDVENHLEAEQMKPERLDFLYRLCNYTNVNWSIDQFLSATADICRFEKCFPTCRDYIFPFGISYC
jgi:hypothetical protein